MRSPIRVTLSAAGASPWILVDYVAKSFLLGLFVSLSQDASGITYDVDLTSDNPNYTKGNSVASLTRSGTTVTVTMAAAHGIVTGDAAVVWNSGDPFIDGSWTVASTPSDTQFTYTVSGSATATAGSAYTQSTQQRVFAGPTALTAATTRANAALQEPCLAVRLRISAWTAGSATLEVVQGLARG